MSETKKKYWQAAFIVVAILLLDQALKLWMKLTMQLDEAIHITDWFQLRFAENPGMAFSMELPGNYGKIFLTLFRVVAVGFMGYFIHRLIQEKKPAGLIWCVSMIMAGAAGNIIDSMFYGILFSDSYGQVASFMPVAGGYAGFLEGHVVDMFYFPLFKGFIPQWSPIMAGEYFVFFSAIFNVADAAITVGVIIVILFYKKFFPEEESTTPATHTDTAAESTEE